MGGEESPLGLLEPPPRRFAILVPTCVSRCQGTTNVYPNHVSFFRGEREKAVPNMSRQRRDQSTHGLYYIGGDSENPCSHANGMLCGGDCDSASVFFSFFFLLPENSAMPAPSLRVPMFSTDARRKG